MGVTKLGEYIKKECPQAARKVNGDLEQFRGQRWVVDTSGVMYKFVNTCDSLESHAHLHLFVYMYQTLAEHQITACFIFDGAQTFAKEEENAKRSVTKKKTQEHATKTIEQVHEKIEQIEKRLSDTPGDMDDQVTLGMLRGELQKAERKQTRVVHRHYYRQLKELFDQHRVPYATALYEAEQACTWLVKHNFADLIISDDYDCLASGAPTFLQHFTLHLEKARFIDLDPILKSMQLSHEEFVEVCILMGTDFGGKLPGIGRARALKIIQKHKTIETFLASPEGKRYRPDTPFDYSVPRTMFLDDSFPLASHHNLQQSFADIMEAAETAEQPAPRFMASPEHYQPKRQRVVML